MINNLKIRILIVDDHEIVLEGIASIISSDPNLFIIDRAKNGEEALEMYEKYVPDIVILDINLPIMNGIEVTKAILNKKQDARIIILSAHNEDEMIFEAIQAGVYAYLPKEFLVDELIQTIHSVYNGKRVINSDIATQYFQASLRPSLSEREKEVLNLIAKGLKNREIAVELNLVEGTVKIHVHNIIKKLNVNDRTGAVVEGIRRGIIIV